MVLGGYLTYGLARNEDKDNMIKTFETIKTTKHPKTITDVLTSVSASSVTGIIKPDDKIFSAGSDRDYVEILEDGIILHSGETTCLLKHTVSGNEGRVSVSNLKTGILIRAETEPETPLELELRISPEALKTSCTSQVFSVLKRSSFPSSVLSLLYALSDSGAVIPARMEPFMKGPGRYLIRINTEMPGTVFLEFLLYFQKIIGDTPVSEHLPDTSDPFCAMAFVGKTGMFGTQSLYSKILPASIKEYLPRNIISAKMHIPVIYGNPDLLEVYPLDERFCSFETTWNYKKEKKNAQLVHSCENQMMDIDLPVGRNGDGVSVFPEGIVIENPGNDYCVLSTADCCSYPQQLEICYKR